MPVVTSWVVGGFVAAATASSSRRTASVLVPPTSMPIRRLTRAPSGSRGRSRRRRGRRARCEPFSAPDPMARRSRAPRVPRARSRWHSLADTHPRVRLGPSGTTSRWAEFAPVSTAGLGLDRPMRSAYIRRHEGRHPYRPTAHGHAAPAGGVGAPGGPFAVPAGRALDRAGPGRPLASVLARREIPVRRAARRPCAPGRGLPAREGGDRQVPRRAAGSAW